MKKLVLIIIIPFLMISCEKGYLVPENELPEWLRICIEKDEQIIKIEPVRGTAPYGSWVRTEWKGEYFYEYFNPLYSLFQKPISHIGDTLNFFVNDNNTAYYKEKCCVKDVWKGPKYKGY